MNERKAGESFSDYRFMQKKFNIALKIFKKGRLFYSPFSNINSVTGKPTPYRNPDKRPCCCLT